MLAIVFNTVIIQCVRFYFAVHTNTPTQTLFHCLRIRLCPQVYTMPNRFLDDDATCRHLLNEPRAEWLRFEGGRKARAFTYLIRLGSFAGSSVTKGSGARARPGTIGVASLFDKMTLWEIDTLDDGELLFRLRPTEAGAHSTEPPTITPPHEATTPAAAVSLIAPAGTTTKYAAPAIFGLAAVAAQVKHLDDPAYTLQLAPPAGGVVPFCAGCLSNTSPFLPRMFGARRLCSVCATQLHSVRRPEAETAVLATHLSGITYSQAAAWHAVRNEPPPLPPATFYRAQKTQAEVIARVRNDLLDEVLRNHRDRDVTLAIDGTWSHRRNAQQATVTVLQAGKIFDIQHVIFTRQRKEAGSDPRILYFQGNARAMEGEGLAVVMSRLQSAGVQVRGIIKDGDSSAMAVVRRCYPEARPLSDHNHLVVAFKKRLANSKSIYGLRGRDGQLVRQLRRFLQLARNDSLAMDRRDYLLRIAADAHVRHLQGDCTRCPTAATTRAAIPVDDASNNRNNGNNDGSSDNDDDDDSDSDNNGGDQQVHELSAQATPATDGVTKGCDSCTV